MQKDGKMSLPFFGARTQKNYRKSQLKNKWDTLKKDWKLWTELLRNSPGIEWCPVKKTVDATEWWVEKIQENSHYKTFKKRGIDPGLNEMLWQMFGDTTATGELAWAPSSVVLPGEASAKDATPVEELGDSNEVDTTEMRLLLMMIEL